MDTDKHGFFDTNLRELALTFLRRRRLTNSECRKYRSSGLFIRVTGCSKKEFKIHRANPKVCFTTAIIATHYQAETYSFCTLNSSFKK